MFIDISVRDLHNYTLNTSENSESTSAVDYVTQKVLIIYTTLGSVSLSPVTVTR